MEILTPIKEIKWIVNAEDLARYAWVSGDINPIHFDKNAAKELGLESTIVHGLFAQSRITAELNLAAVAQGLGRLKKTHTKFSAMMPCPGTYQIQVFKTTEHTLVGKVLNAEGVLCVEVGAETHPK